MPAVDNCEPQVVRAMEKDGWQVVRRHYLIRLGKGRGAVYADLRLQKDEAQILIVEVKSFERRGSQMDDLYQAIGQYMVYQKALALAGQREPLYLALPETAFRRLRVHDAIQATIQDAKIKLILVDISREEVVEWVH
ncbi:MAG TPA: element excision factor XisH family protein [Aggregatilineales bacterium]|nr:element excision factor XisH family protein [Aggregatilineales bacterium]